MILPPTVIYSSHRTPGSQRRNPPARETAEERVLLTEDKDFGELAFLQRLVHPCIIRFVEMTVAEKVAAMEDLLAKVQATMRQGTTIVVTKTRVIVRYTESQ